MMQNLQAGPGMPFVAGSAHVLRELVACSASQNLGDHSAGTADMITVAGLMRCR